MEKFDLLEAATDEKGFKKLGIYVATPGGPIGLIVLKPYGFRDLIGSKTI